MSPLRGYYTGVMSAILITSPEKSGQALRDFLIKLKALNKKIWNRKS